MTAPVAFYPNLAFGKLELLAPDGGREADIPSWVIDAPHVLAALTLLAGKGGTAALSRAPDWHDVVVDVAAAEIIFQMGEDR